MNRGAKTGVLNGIFEAWPAKKNIPVRIEGYSLDSTSVKVHPDGTGALKKTESSRLESHQEGGQKNHLLAQDAGTAIAFRLSPGNCHAAPEGEAWLKGIDCPFPGRPMIMDRADEGDTTRQRALDLIFSAVVPPNQIV